MNKHDLSQQNSSLFHKDSSKSKVKFKQMISKSRQFETICLNHSQIKHAHAIRPYSSKQRKTSRRDSKQTQSPHQLSRSKSKRFDSSSKKHEELPLILGGKKISDMYSQLASLKQQYKSLKNNYNKLLIDKKQIQKHLISQNKNLLSQLDQKGNALQIQKKNNNLLQRELQRIKKQCIKVIEIQKFKAKKLEETIQEKELMIAFLRNQLKKVNQSETQNSSNQLFFMGNSVPLNFDYFNKPVNISSISQIANPLETCKHSKIAVQDDSLSFSKDKSKQAQSLIHSFLSHDHSQINHNFNKKEPMHANSLDQSPIPQQIEIIDQASQKSQKSIIQPQKSQNESRNVTSRQQTDSVLQKIVEFGDSTSQPVNNMSKINQKKLQISINDQNYDTMNLTQEVPAEVKKKPTSQSTLRHKKKIASKKLKAQ